MSHSEITTSATVANNVKSLRTRKGLRQSDLADAVGVTRQTILAIEKGRLNPSIPICLRIAAALDTPVGSIFYLDAGSEKISGRETLGDCTLSCN